MADIQLDPYIFFTGECKEAMDFYKGVFGGDLKMQTYDEVPEEAKMPGMEGKIMHSLLSGGAIRLMASDGTRKDPYPAGPISLSMSGSDEAQLTEIFNKLAEGGEITMKLDKQFWGDIFGGVTDKYSIEWMVNVNAKEE